MTKPVGSVCRGLPWVAAVAALLSGCPTCVRPDPGPAGLGESCADGIGCQDGLLCVDDVCVAPGADGGTGSSSSSSSSGGPDAGPRECTNVLQCAIHGSIDGRECVDGHCVFKSCSADAQCGARRCVDGQCADVTRCTSDQECPEGVCTDGACQAGCQDDTACNAGQVLPLYLCDQGHCRQRCLGDTTCLLQSGTICENGMCVPPQCQVDSECAEPGAHRECANGRCQDFAPCHADSECGGDTFFCTGDGKCRERPACLQDADCGAGFCLANHCQAADACGPGMPPCAGNQDCMGGRCVPAAGCRGNSECAGNQVCRAGTCADPPVATVARVLIATPAGLCDPVLVNATACQLHVRPGENVLLSALTLDAAGRIIAGQPVAWQSAAEDVAAVAGLGTQGMLTAGTAAGTSAVTASVNAVVSPPLSVHNLGPAPAGVRVAVVDGPTGAPVSGATVQVNDKSAVTGPDGVAAWPDGALTGPFTLSVFHGTHDYVTLVDIPAETGGGLDAVVPLDVVTPPRQTAGLRGTVNLDAAPSQGEVSLSLSGLSSPSVASLSFARLLGDTFNVDVTLPVLGTQRLPLPGGITLAAEIPLLGPYTFKDSFQVLGSGGRRVAWTFGGKIPLSVLQGLLTGGLADPVNVLFALVPSFAGLTHGLGTGLVLTDLPYVRDGDTEFDGIPDVNNNGNVEELVPDYGAFPQVTLAVRQPQDLYLGIRFQGFPAGAAAAQALVTAGARVPGHGFTPLGLTSIPPEQAAMAPVPLKLAPRYGGLEAGDYAVAAFAFGAAAGNAPVQMSMLTLATETLPREADLGAFLPFPSGSTFQGRQLSVRDVADAHLLRAVLTGPDGRWVVYVSAGAGPRSVGIPDVPAGMPDRAVQGSVMEAVQVSEALRSAVPQQQLQALVGAAGHLALQRLERETVALSRAELPTR